MVSGCLGLHSVQHLRCIVVVAGGGGSGGEFRWLWQIRIAGKECWLRVRGLTERVPRVLRVKVGRGGGGQGRLVVVVLVCGGGVDKRSG